MKRNQDELDHEPPQQPRKRRLLSDDDARSCFRNGLFDPTTLHDSTEQYSASQPYNHGVIANLLDPELLRNVRAEITTNISFAPKETDIYKIHQSGDLANLDGLDDASLTLLPSLVKLRDALYSAPFRHYLSKITGAGHLSGTKTDMAVNVYTPTCHLLCHDDVIGTRRVSYILYLTDPDRPWKPEWGGALRLYPTKLVKTQDGSNILAPSTHWSHSIPPAFNQLSFFAVQPGKSFHDVEEVYVKPSDKPDEDDGGRVRMAISGWYHIPQYGEPGFEPGLHEALTDKSSLAQLQGNSNAADLPQPRWIGHDDNIPSNPDEAANTLTEADLDFLLKFMNARYLTPETVEELAESFAEDSSLRLGMFLSNTFEELLRNDLTRLDRDQKSTTQWETARPPHKHRFKFLQARSSPNLNLDPNRKALKSPHQRLLDELFPSHPFKKWLSHATGLELNDCHILARRFRRGLDYTLATAYEDRDPQLEVSFGMTPSGGWGGDDEADDPGNTEDVADPESGLDQDISDENKNHDEDPDIGDQVGQEIEMEENNNEEDEDEGDDNDDDLEEAENDEQEDAGEKPSNAAQDGIDNVGGYEVYMAGDDDGQDDGQDENEAENNGAGTAQAEAQLHGNASSSHTGAGNRRRRRADPAVYGQSNDEDSGILLSVPASWNTLTLVLRDHGTLRFVKYVSQAAQGDRWDVSGIWKVEENWDSDEEDSENGIENIESHQQSD